MSARSFVAPSRRGIVLLVLAGCLAIVAMTVYLCATLLPAAGAQGADALRRIVGDQVVASLEMTVYQVQDNFQRLAYQLGIARPATPWAVAPISAATARPSTPVPTVTSAAPALAAMTTITFRSTTPAAASTATAAATASAVMPTFAPSATHPSLSPTATPAAPAPWPPAVVTAYGTLPGEGQWSAYLSNPSGQTVAYRTFLQPDPERPYVVVAIVAFDLSATHLKFVLGSSEPESSVEIYRPGRIPADDLQSGLLLAAFNGGFKARHGGFGAMVNGVTVLPPRPKHGTIAFYTDGTVRLGAWGTDILPSPDLVAWRQNGPLIIHNGQLNPHTADTAPDDWGYTVNGETAVWRSGLGLSGDGRTLYYFAGPQLTLPALASAMAATGADQAMQLDINSYWVHFTSIEAHGPKLQAFPLLDTMNLSVSRYLYSYARDFFYVVANR